MYRWSLLSTNIHWHSALLTFLIDFICVWSPITKHSFSYSFKYGFGTKKFFPFFIFSMRKRVVTVIEPLSSPSDDMQVGILSKTVHRCSIPHSHFLPSIRRNSYTSFTPCGNTAVTVATPSKGVITFEPTFISPIVCHP